MTPPRAALPMYPRAETAAAEARLWGGMRALLPGLPQSLSDVTDLWAHWTDPALVFSQSCSAPYRHRLHGRVRIVATPDYGLEGCAPGKYRSLFVMRKGAGTQDPEAWARLRFACNSRSSQSGWIAATTTLARQGLRLSPALETGAHLASMAAVAEGAADLAAIDAHTWRLAVRHDALPSALEVVGATDPSPATPYVTGPSGDPEALAAALAAAVCGLSDADRRTMGLRGIVRLPVEAYLAVADSPEDQANAAASGAAQL